MKWHGNNLWRDSGNSNHIGGDRVMDKTYVQERLADIRMENAKWSASTDTSSWHDTFLLDLLDEKTVEIKKLKTENRKLGKSVADLTESLDRLTYQLRATRK